MPRRVFYIFLTLNFLLFSFKTPLLAAVDPENVLIEHVDAVNSGSSLEPFLGVFGRNANLIGLLDAFIDLKSVAKNILKGVLTEDSRHWIPGGVVGSTTQLAAITFIPAASGVQYIADSWNSFLGRPAYAQNSGVGFIGLQPILPIWRSFRNAVYILSSVLFIMVGIMIMLRVKISPQAVVSLQNAVPKIISTLILVTFSYAIAGLIIDFLTLIQGFALATLFSSKGVALGDQLFRNVPGINSQGLPLLASYANFFNFRGLSQTGFFHFFSMTFMLVPYGTLLLFGGGLGYVIGSLFGALGGSPVTLIAGQAAGFGIGAVLVTLIIIAMIIFWMLKFFFGAVKCYVTAIFKIIIAPLEIAMGAFPNSKVGFNTWIWDLIANLAVFPISVLFLVVANLIIEASNNSLWSPSLIGGTAVNIPFVLSGGIVPVFIGIGALMIVSQLPVLVPQAIFMLKPTAWETAIGQGMKSFVDSPLAALSTAASVTKGVSEISRPISNWNKMRKQTVSPNIPENELHDRLQFGSQNTNVSSRPGSDQNNTASRRPNRS